MANTERTIDLDADPGDFTDTYAYLLVAVKRNYDAAGNLAGAMDPSLATRFIIAEYTNLIDDFIIECQETKLRFLRFGAGAPAIAADIGTQYTDTATGNAYVNRTGTSAGWGSLGVILYDGDPEGAVAAPVGSLLCDTNGGGTALLYFKRTGGVTPTGWAEIAIA